MAFINFTKLPYELQTEIWQLVVDSHVPRVGHRCITLRAMFFENKHTLVPEEVRLAMNWWDNEDLISELSTLDALSRVCLTSRAIVLRKRPASIHVETSDNGRTVVRWDPREAVIYIKEMGYVRVENPEKKSFRGYRPLKCLDALTRVAISPYYLTSIEQGGHLLTVRPDMQLEWHILNSHHPPLNPDDYPPIDPDSMTLSASDLERRATEWFKERLEKGFSPVVTSEELAPNLAYLMLMKNLEELFVAHWDAVPQPSERYVRECRAWHPETRPKGLYYSEDCFYEDEIERMLENVDAEPRNSASVDAMMRVARAMVGAGLLGGAATTSDAEGKRKTSVRVRKLYVAEPAMFNNVEPEWPEDYFQFNGGASCWQGIVFREEYERLFGYWTASSQSESQPDPFNDETPPPEDGVGQSDGSESGETERWDDAEAANISGPFEGEVDEDDLDDTRGGSSMQETREFDDDGGREEDEYSDCKAGEFDEFNDSPELDNDADDEADEESSYRHDPGSGYGGGGDEANPYNASIDFNNSDGYEDDGEYRQYGDRDGYDDYEEDWG